MTNSANGEELMPALNLTPKSQYIADIMVAAHRAINAGVPLSEIHRLTDDFAADLGETAIAEAGQNTKSDPEGEKP